MYTPAIVFLMMANTIATSGAILVAWQISHLELGREQQPTQAKISDDTDGETGRVEGTALAKAARQSRAAQSSDSTYPRWG